MMLTGLYFEQPFIKFWMFVAIFITHVHSLYPFCYDLCLIEYFHYSGIWPK